MTLYYIMLLAASPSLRVVTVASRLHAAIGAKLVDPHGCLPVGMCHAFGAPISRVSPLSILLLVAIGAKLVGIHGGLHVGK